MNMGMTAEISQMSGFSGKIETSKGVDENSDVFQKLLSVFQKSIEKGSMKTSQPDICSIIAQLLNIISPYPQNQITIQSPEYELNIDSDLTRQIQSLWDYLIEGYSKEGNIGQEITELNSKLNQYGLQLAHLDIKDFQSKLQNTLNTLNESEITLDTPLTATANENPVHRKNSIEELEASIEPLNLSPEKSNFRPITERILQDKKKDEVKPKEMKSKVNPLMRQNLTVKYGFGKYFWGESSTLNDVIQVGVVNQNRDPVEVQCGIRNTEIGNKLEISVENDTLNETPQILDQTVDKIETMISGHEKQISVRLKPEYLGDMIIKISTNRDEIKAQLFIENGYTKDILQLNAPEIRNHLIQNGINLTDIDFYDMSENAMGWGDFNSNSSYNGSNYARREQTYYKYENADLDSYPKLKTPIALDLECNINYVV